MLFIELGVGDDDAHVVDDCSTRGALGAEGCHRHVVLVVEDLVELEEELDDARELEIFVLEFLHEVLPLVHGLVGFGRLRLDSNRIELVAPQVLERHGFFVLDVVPRHLEHFGVDALALPLHVVIVGAVLMLAQRPLECGIVGALESRCRVGD